MLACWLAQAVVRRHESPSTTSVLTLQDVTSWRVLQRRMMSIPQRMGLPLGTGSSGQPGSPIRPPTTIVAMRRLTPSGRRVRFIVVRPIGALSAWWIDNARNVTARRKHEARLSSDELLNAPCRVPGHDMVLFGTDGIDIQPYLSQVERDTFELNLTGLDQIVLHIGVAEIPAMGSTRHARPVAIPV